jgi:hypothetical protein
MATLFGLIGWGILSFIKLVLALLVLVVIYTIFKSIIATFLSCMIVYVGYLLLGSPNPIIYGIGILIFFSIFAFFGSESGSKESKTPLVAKSIKEKQRSRTISREVVREVWRRDQHKCVQCGSQENLELDHLIPFSKGGSNTARNIRLLCEKCNREKSDKI